ncbi:single-stranded-DNA-specific exonuclease RecJ [Phenylobacterium sp.]|uniref:single-stranded-DNA-specific exonuclease RecJ n=1 Tax=Phenylobacterium sp. TaxID=1871053 RepID=UPI003563D986
MADGSAQLGYLGVTRSLSGRLWRERAADAELVRRHQLSHSLSEPLARALAARGVLAEQGETYLNPTLKALFPDPSTFSDMDRAAEILVDALERKRPLVVFADYDVDGASSAAQLVRWFRALGHDLPIYVPDRILEGYGPSPAAFRRLKAEGAELVITVDCGAAAHDALACATEIGLEVVVIDHHLMRGEGIPHVAALVNPNRPDCVSGQGHLAAAGVTFVLLAALNREARKRGLFGERPEPDLRQWLDLAAMGAICDVTELRGFNRALAAQGLKVMSAWRNPGLKALAEVAKRADGPASVFDVGFILGPRINAGGRIGRADLGARLLSTDDAEEARGLAEELDTLNASRKEVEREVTEAAIAHIESESNQGEASMLLVAADDWHPGVIGIVAGRLREKYRKPVVVVGVDRAANVGKGSGRSQPGVNLGRAVQAAYDEGLLLAGGGHAMAAGLSVRPDTIPELRAFLCERLAAESEIATAADALEIDALVTTRGCDRALWQDFQRMAPFGPGNVEPTFAAADVRVERPMALRGGHVRCTLTDGSGGKLKAVAWRVEGSEAGRRLMTEGGAVHVAGRLKPDDWQGRQGVEFEIEDVADPRRA